MSYLFKLSGPPVITKKITKDMEKRLLRIIFQRYTEEYGYGIRQLSEYRVFIASGSSFEEEMPEIVEYDPEENEYRYLLLDLLIELRAKGYIQSSDDNRDHWLTEKGYEHASKSRLEHLLTYWNNNAGLAIPLAIISLIVSVFALFIG